MLHDNDLATIATDDVLGVNQCPGKSSADERQDQEANVGSVADRLGLGGVDALAERDLADKVSGGLAKEKPQNRESRRRAMGSRHEQAGSTHQTTNDGAQVEDHPEPGNVSTLGVFGRVRHHDGTLGAPENSCADTQQGSRKGGEAQVLCVVVAEEGADVDRVADATKGEGSADAQLVGEGSCEETYDGEGRVESRVGVVVCGGVHLASTAHAVDGVEHAGAQEADKGNDDQLDGRRSIPGKATENLLVLPRVWQLEDAIGLSDGGLWCGDVMVGLFLFWFGHCEKGRSAAGWEDGSEEEGKGCYESRAGLLLCGREGATALGACLLWSANDGPCMVDSERREEWVAQPF